MFRGLDPAKFRVKHHRRGELDADEVFVLVPSRDPAALAALRAYARNTPDVKLAAELLAWAERVDNVSATQPLRPDPRTMAVWVGTLAREVREGRMAIETALQRMAGHAMRYIERAHEGSP